MFYFPIKVGEKSLLHEYFRLFSLQINLFQESPKVIFFHHSVPATCQKFVFFQKKGFWDINIFIRLNCTKLTTIKNAVHTLRNHVNNIHIYYI